MILRYRYRSGRYSTVDTFECMYVHDMYVVRGTPETPGQLFVTRTPQRISHCPTPLQFYLYEHGTQQPSRHPPIAPLPVPTPLGNLPRLWLFSGRCLLWPMLWHEWTTTSGRVVAAPRLSKRRPLDLSWCLAHPALCFVLDDAGRVQYECCFCHRLAPIEVGTRTTTQRTRQDRHRLNISWRGTARRQATHVATRQWCRWALWHNDQFVLVGTVCWMCLAVPLTKQWRKKQTTTQRFLWGRLGQTTEPV